MADEIKALCLRMPLEFYAQVKKRAEDCHLNMTTYILRILKDNTKPVDHVQVLTDRVQVLEADVQFLKERWRRFVVSMKNIHAARDDIDD